MPRMCIGKKTQLYRMNVSQKWTFPHRSLIIRPNIFGYQYTMAPNSANRLPPNST